MSCQVINSNSPGVKCNRHLSITPLAKFHGHIIKTFSPLPSKGKFIEVVKRIFLVVVSPFAYLTLGFIALAEYPCTKNIKKQTFENSGTVGKLYAALKSAKKDEDRKNIYLKIASEEIKQKNNKAASSALDKLTKILDRQSKKSANAYCEVARMRITLKPDAEPYELKKADEIAKSERNDYYLQKITPPAYLSDHITDLARCYHLLNNQTKVNEQIEALKEFAEKFKKHNSHGYLGVIESLAQFQIEINQIEEAKQLIDQIIIPQICEKFSGIDMKPSIRICVSLAESFIEQGHINEPVPSLIKAAEQRFAPWKEKTGFDVEELRDLIKDVNEKLVKISFEKV